jgi:diguanylate cyclase (GGDEF)-like protein
VRLKESLRASDTAARVGGDEFAVLLEGTHEPAGVLVAERLLSAWQEPISLQGSRIVVSASIGVAERVR